MLRSSYKNYLAGLLLVGISAVATAAEWSGNLTAEYQGFPSSPSYSGQVGDNFSGSGQLSFVHEWDDGQQIFAFVPFVRVDQHDDQRSHGDIRELTWVKVADSWELRLGIRKVFWGVTESQHLVDIINQTDLVESPDGEEKLGQPMVNLALIRDWGTVDLFILPYFRERTFPGIEGRLRTPLPVDDDQAIYQSDDEQQHLDYALRWSHYLGDWDVGLSYFDGTSRDPELRNGGSVLIPYYDQIQQWGVDLQATKGGWLWKLEGIHRRTSGDDYSAAVGGFEYTLYGVLESGSDVGLVMEYLYDERSDTAPLQNDLMVGVRWTMNDVQSTEALFGTITDLETGSAIYSLEASRRLGDNWKMTLEGRVYQPDSTDPIYLYRNDDYLQVELGCYF
jgi:hypothetical protein